MTTFTEEQIKYLETKIDFLDEGDVEQGFSVLGNILGSVWGSILGSVEGDVRRSVWGSVLGSVRGSVLGSVQGNVWGSVKGSVKGSVLGNILGDVKGSVLGNILGDVKGSVLGSVEGRVIEDVRADLVTPAPAVKVKTPVTAAQAMAQTRENYAETISNLKRIDELEANLEAAEQRGYANAMEAERKLHEDHIEELEAKLALAVKALEDISGNGSAAGRNQQLMADKARVTLAELKGQNDE